MRGKRLIVSIIRQDNVVYEQTPYVTYAGGKRNDVDIGIPCMCVCVVTTEGIYFAVHTLEQKNLKNHRAPGAFSPSSTR